MSFADDHPGYEIVTEEQARNWILEQLSALELARFECNVVFPGDRTKTVEHQRSAYRRFLVKHGGLLGMLTTLHRCRRLGDVAYNELRGRILKTLGATIVGGE